MPLSWPFIVGMLPFSSAAGYLRVVPLLSSGCWLMRWSFLVSRFSFLLLATGFPISLAGFPVVGNEMTVLPSSLLGVEHQYSSMVRIEEGGVRRRPSSTLVRNAW